MNRIEFLKNTTPFDTLPEEVLERVANELQEVNFKDKGIIYQQHNTKITGLDLIYEGGYMAFFFDSHGVKQHKQKLRKNDTYGAFSILLNKGKSINTVEVKEKTKVLKVAAPLFKELCNTHEEFYQKFLSVFGKEMLDEKYAHYVIKQEARVEDAITYDRYFNSRLEPSVMRYISSCSPDTPAYEAAAMMEEEKISCIFIQDKDSYIGYVTDIILRNKIIADRRDSDTPVKDIMETDIYSITMESYIYEAILLMFKHKIRYLLVEENGETKGVISRNKLLADQAQSPFIFLQSVRQAISVEELEHKWSEVPELAYNLLTRGVKSELVNEVISNISDTIDQKVIDGVIEEMGPPPAKFVYMCLGSEGRKEQTLKTDQDNAIIYEDKANEFRELTREYFLTFADKVSERLNTIGFTYCSGGLMAKNPRWTHSLSHWKRNYDKWIEEPNPEAVMNFSTFFDCRLIYGDEELIAQLQGHILKKLHDPGEYFFAQLANNALQYEPPLSFFRGIKTISKGEKKVFNIKRAMTPLVDLVRVYALRYKILKTNTGERLQSLMDERVFSEKDYHELMQSYYYLMGMRLKNQAHQIMYDKESPDNFISMDSLTKIEIVTLKEIFKVIENFQQRIKIVFLKKLFG
ncbi:DUF294 nucleotidyltransferase-like domain-containing protein [Fulvivirga maritima]|uniref:DUF294 nucleotidyltransferase-like domain-containing protein n=1 Tax=Fulvivirga maritima TaxID=2904247 RepID=UPI001F48AC1A|nr:DUF294 nucleotidyltransferase-like domain-containing protein [Fulvivirga maritima]UII25670.1 DUF294 nucleotidyltransferase-like domain-containing protein [Fulvivirga maritima]